MLRFAIIGVAGYIAPRHLKAIQDINGQLVAAMDKTDSVGILDSYFPQADFFTEIERFDRHLEKLRRRKEGIDYLVVCLSQLFARRPYQIGVAGARACYL